MKYAEVHLSTRAAGDLSSFPRELSDRSGLVSHARSPPGNEESRQESQPETSRSRTARYHNGGSRKDGHCKASNSDQGNGGRGE